MDIYAILGKGKELKNINHLRYWREKEINVKTYLLLSDFINFAEVYWRFLSLSKLNETQKDICRFLQYGFNPDFEEKPEEKIERILITGYRGMSKSYLTVAYAAWRLYRDPYEKICIVSATSDRAVAFLKQLKTFIFNYKELKFLIPKKDDPNTTEYFNVAPAKLGEGSYSVISKGVFGTVTGFRTNLVIFDDIEVEATALSPTRRERLISRVAEFEHLIEQNEYTDLRGVKILALGTPQTQDSIYMKLPKKGFKKRIWTVYYPIGEQLETLRPYLSPLYLNKIKLNPSLIENINGMKKTYGAVTDDSGRFTPEVLLNRERSVGSNNFNREYMLDINTSAEDFPFKLSDFIVDTINHNNAHYNYKHSNMAENELVDLREFNPSMLLSDRFYKASYKSNDVKPYDYKIMSLDPSGVGKDETSYAIIGVLDGFIYLIDIGGFKGEGGFTKKNINHICDIAIKNEVNTLLVETNSIGAAFVPLLTDTLAIKTVDVNKKGIAVEGYYNTINKKARILKHLTPLLQANKIVINKSIIETEIDNAVKKYMEEGIDEETAIQYTFLYQLTRFRIGNNHQISIAFDDRIDAFNTALMYIEELAAKDSEKASSKRKQEEDEKFWEEMNKEYEKTFNDNQTIDFPCLSNR